MSSMVRTIKRRLIRTGETAGQGLKPEPTTTNCFNPSCNVVIRKDRAHGQNGLLCWSCVNHIPGQR